MPDLFDVTELRVQATDPVVPIVWETIPNRVHEDSNNRSFRTQNYCNEPRDEITMSLATGYTFPSGWRMGRNGRLFYRAILGRSVALKVTASRQGVPSVDSNEFTITRRQAFIERLVPNRINLGLAFNNTTQRVFVYNTTDVDITPVRDYINVFDINGNEQTSESVEVSDINPQGRSGIAWDGSHFWVCGHYDAGSGGEFKKIDADGTLDSTYTYTGGEIESVAFDGTYIWGLDIRQYQLRKFNTSGVEQTGAVSLASATNFDDFSRYYFSQAQYGLTYADGHFWIPQSHFTGGVNKIFCCTTAGVRVSSRDIDVDHGVSGVTYNPTTGNLWWILDRTDDDDNRYGILNAKQI